MMCHRCNIVIEEDEIFEGTVLPFIADGERKFLCKCCTINQPERLSEKTSKEEAIV